MGFPRTLKIGPFKYNASVVASKRWKLGDCLGECDREKRTIYVKGGQTPEDLKETFFHELLHAVWNDRIESTALGTLLVTADRSIVLEQLEEMIVETMSKGLMCMFKDNPKLLRVLEEYIEEYRR